MVRYEELVGKVQPAGDEIEDEVEEVVEENVARKLRVKVGDDLFEPNIAFESNAESLTEYVQEVTEAIKTLQEQKEKLMADSKRIRESITASLKKMGEYMENIQSIEGEIAIEERRRARRQYLLEAIAATRDANLIQSMRDELALLDTKVLNIALHKAAKDMKKAELFEAVSKLAKKLHRTVKVNAKSRIDQMTIIYNQLVELDVKEQLTDDILVVLAGRLEAAKKQLDDEARNYEELTVVTKFNYDHQYVNEQRALIAQARADGDDTIKTDIGEQPLERREQELSDYIRAHTYVEDIQPIIKYVHAQELTGGDFASGDADTHKIEYYENELVKSYVDDINSKILVLNEQKKQALELLSMYVTDLQTREGLIELCQKLTEAYKNNQYYDAATGNYLQLREYDPKKYTSTKNSRHFRIVYLGDTTASANALAAYMHLVQSVFEVKSKTVFLPIVSNLVKSADKEWIYLPIGVYANNNKVTNKITNDTIYIEDREVKVLRIRNNRNDVKYRQYLSEVDATVTKVTLKKRAFAKELDLQGYFNFKMTGFSRLGEEEYIKMKEGELLAAGELKSPTRHKKEERPEQEVRDFMSEVYLPTMDVAFYLTMQKSNMVDKADPLRYPPLKNAAQNFDSRIPVGKKTALINQGRVKDTLYIKSKSSQTYLPVQLKRITARDEIHIYNPYKREWIPIQEYVEENSILEIENSTPILYVTTQDSLFQFRCEMAINHIFFNTSWTHPTTGVVRMTPVRERIRGMILVSDKTVADVYNRVSDLLLFFAARKELDAFARDDSFNNYMAHDDKITKDVLMARDTRIARGRYIVSMLSRLAGVVKSAKAQDYIGGAKLKDSLTLIAKLREFERIFSDVDRVISHKPKVAELELYVDTVIGSVTHQAVTDWWDFFAHNKWPADHLFAITGDGITTVPREMCNYIYKSQLFARIRNSQTLVPVNTAEFSTLLSKQVGFEMATTMWKDRQQINMPVASAALLNLPFDGMSERDRLFVTQYKSLIETHPFTGEKREEVYRQLGVDPYLYPVKLYSVVEVTYKTKKRSQPIPIQHRPEPKEPVVERPLRLTGLSGDRLIEAKRTNARIEADRQAAERLAIANTKLAAERVAAERLAAERLNEAKKYTFTG